MRRILSSDAIACYSLLIQEKGFNFSLMQMKLPYVTATIRKKAELRNYIMCPQRMGIHFPLPPTLWTRLRESILFVYDYLKCLIVVYGLWTLWLGILTLKTGRSYYLNLKVKLPSLYKRPNSQPPLIPQMIHHSYFVLP